MTKPRMFYNEQTSDEKKKLVNQKNTKNLIQIEGFHDLVLENGVKNS